MGTKDTVTKDYMADPEIFADAFNYLLYDGRQVIRPEQLHRKDTAALAVPYGKGAQERKASKNDASAGVQRYRDNLKSWVMMEDDGMTYLILGIEGQSQQHPAMPVRNMLYDALQYAEQVDETAKRHRRERKAGKPPGALFHKKPASRGEFLSGFYEDDRLVPVITLVILFDTEPWTGPVSLHDMFSVQDEKILQYVPDYPINLLAPAAMSDEEINRLSSSLREVILFIRYATDKGKMAELMRENDRFRHLDRQAANVINVLTNCGLEIDEEKEEVDMCIAWEEMKKDAERLGLEKGEKLGLEKGALTFIANLMDSNGWSLWQAMDALKIPKDEQTYYAARLKS